MTYVQGVAETSCFFPFTDRARDDFLKIFEEMLRKIAAVKANRFVGVIGVVVVPIEQRTGSLGSQLQRVHSDNTGDIHFAVAPALRLWWV